MRVMVFLEDRFFKTRNGSIYSNTNNDYSLWCRYLQVFDEVLVAARVSEIPAPQLDRSPANGPSVNFYPLPYYVGPWQYLLKRREINRLAKQAIGKANAFILRIPSGLGTLVWRHLMCEKIPYGVEVIGSSLDSAKTLGTNVLLKNLLARVWVKNQKLQCRHAAAAAYVTEDYLQKLCPPGAWATYFSDVDLADSAITGDDRLEEHLMLVDDAVNKGRPFRICHAGTMEVLYKGQDKLLQAIALCRANGHDIQLVLLGDGRCRQYLAEKAKVLGISESVEFLGSLPPGDEVREQLDKADLFVLPSLTEGMPRVLIEAMARGLPCIGSSVGGIPELLDPEDMVPPGKPRILSQSIESVIGDIERLKKMARRNLNTAKKYRADELNKRRVGFYRKLVEQTSIWHESRHRSSS